MGRGLSRKFEQLLHLEIGNETLQRLPQAALHQSPRVALLAVMFSVARLPAGLPELGVCAHRHQAPTASASAIGCTEANLASGNLIALCPSPVPLSQVTLLVPSAPGAVEGIRRHRSGLCWSTAALPLGISIPPVLGSVLARH